MKLRCIGVHEKEGKFTNKETGEVVDYHKYDLYCTGPKPDFGVLHGDYVEIVPIRHSQFRSFGYAPEDLPGEDIEIDYNKYGRVSQLAVLS